VVEVEARPLAGYVFAGAEKATDGRSALWAWYDAVMAKPAPVTLPDGKGGQVEVQERGWRDRPFHEVMGPFDAGQLQQFVEAIGPRVVGALFERRHLVLTFPARAAKILEDEVVLLTPPQDAPMGGALAAVG